MKTLKLFVWENVLVDYTPGVMFAYAYDVEHARQLLIQKDHVVEVLSDLAQQPKEITEPEGFTLWGGG